MRRQTAAMLFLSLMALATRVRADRIQEMLAAKSLQGDFNPVLVSYLLEEGKSTLPQKQRQEALDQQVARFKEELNVRPSGTATAAAATLAGMFMKGSAGEVMRDASASVWTSWVDGAFVLLHAGYAKDVAPFFQNCIQNFPYEELQSRCAIGLAAAQPDDALKFLTSLLSNDHPAEVSNAALRMLGALAADESYPRAQRDAAIAEIAKHTEGMMNSIHYAAAADGLVIAHDPHAVEPLRKLTKGFKGDEEKHIALRGLAVVYHDQEALETLKKSLKGGFMSNDKDQLFAGTTLIEAGDAAGDDWALAQLVPKKKGFMARAMSLDESHDNSVPVVRALVERGDDNARAVLTKALDGGASYPAIYVVALYGLGDASRADETKKIAMSDDHATNLRTRAAMLVATKSKDMSVIAALDAMARDRRTEVGDRIGIADALGTIDGAEAAALATSMLDDKDASVRTVAAYSLARMKNPAALKGLAKVMTTKFGTNEDRPVEATAVRAAAANFGRSAGELLASAAGSPYASVQFLAAAASQKPAAVPPPKSAGARKK